MPDVLEVIARIRKEGSLDPLNKEIKGMGKDMRQMSMLLSRVTNVFTQLFKEIGAASEAFKNKVRFDDLAKEQGQSTDQMLARLKELSGGTVQEADLMKGAIEAMSSDNVNALKSYELELQATFLEMTAGERALAGMKGGFDEVKNAMADSIATGLIPYAEVLKDLFQTEGERLNLIKEGQGIVIQMAGFWHALTKEGKTFNEAMEFGVQVWEEWNKVEEERLRLHEEDIRAAGELRRQQQELNKATQEGTKALEDITRAEERHQEKLEQIMTAGTERRLDNEAKFLASREDLYRDQGIKLQDSWLEHTRELEDIEQNYKDRIEDINERSNVNLEEAIRRRDARGIVEAKRSKAEEIEIAGRDRERSIRDAQLSYQREQADLERTFNQRLEAMEAQYSREQAALQISIGAKRAAQEAAYAAERERLIAHVADLNKIIESLGGKALNLAGAASARAQQFIPSPFGMTLNPAWMAEQAQSQQSQQGQSMGFGSGAGQFRMQHGGAMETTVPTSFMTSEFGQKEGVVVAPGGLQNVGGMMGGGAGGQAIRVHLTISGDEIVKGIVRDVIVEEMIGG